jgi:hypothetical protein
VGINATRQDIQASGINDGHIRASFYVVSNGMNLPIAHQHVCYVIITSGDDATVANEGVIGKLGAHEPYPCKFYPNEVAIEINLF